MKKTAILIVLLLFSCYSISFAQYTLSGDVTEEVTGEPLSGAHISLQNTYYNTVSDPSGKFKFNNLKDGEYTIVATYMGFNAFTKTVLLSGTDQVELKLQKAVILEEAVVIRATRVDQNAPGTYTNVEMEEIQTMNLGKDIPYLLNFTPSITTTSDAGNDIGYSQLRLRGTDITRINVTINGIPLNDPESHNVYWIDLPDLGSSVNNIQIQRGVGTSTNGAAAFGGSLNIQTSTLQTKPYAILDNSFGSFNSRKHNLSAGTGLIKDKFAFDIRLSQIASDGYVDRATADMKSYFFSGAFYGESNMLKVNIFSGDERTYQAWNGIPKDSLETNRTYNPSGEYIDDDGNIKYYDDQTDNYKQSHFQLLFSQQMGKFNLNLAAFYTKGNGYYQSWKNNQKLANYGEDYFTADSSVTRSDLIRQKWLDNDYSGVTLSGIWDAKKKIKLTVGGAYSNYAGNHFGYALWAKDAIINNPDNPWYENRGEKSDANIYTKLNWFINGKINLYADLQYRYIHYTCEGTHDNLEEINIDKTYNFLNPKAGIFYEITDQHKSYFSFAIANREPNRRNFLDADSGNVPTFETLYDFELGYDFSKEKFSLGVNLYYMHYHNQLVLTGKINNVGDPIMQNVPLSHRTGIELTAGAKIVKRLDWNMNFTLSQNRIDTYTEYTDNWDVGGQDSQELSNTNLSFSPDIIAYNLFSYEAVDNLFIKLESKYVGKQYIDNTSNENRILDAYFVNGIIINYMIHTSIIEEIGIDLIVNNIFNTKYETNAWVYKYSYKDQPQELSGYFPQAGINFMLGLHLKF